MSKRKLVLFAGGDRVGKSTLIANISSDLGPDKCSTYHHGVPDTTNDNIFDIYRNNINRWLETTNTEYALFDRSWACAYVLESYRRHSYGHLDDVIDLELECLSDSRYDILHVAVEKPWSWSAKHHLIELNELFPESKPWYIRDEYVARMKEHKVYYEKLYDFYHNVTAFTHHIHNIEYRHTNKDIESDELFRSINQQFAAIS